MGGGGTTCPLCRRVVYVLELGYDRLGSTWDDGLRDVFWREAWASEPEDGRAERVIAGRDRAAGGGRERWGGGWVAGYMREGVLQRHQGTHRQVWSRLAGVVAGENGRVGRRDGRGSSF